MKKAIKKPIKEVVGTGEFHEPKEVRIDVQDAKKYFPDKTLNGKPTEFNKLRFTDVALYSTTPPNQATYTTNLLLYFYSVNELNTKIITDGNSCIGGNTWSFASVVKHVNAVEISELHAKILKNNLDVLNYTNISIYNKNYVEVYDEIEQDILFLDPPWGGVDYKNSTVELEYVYKNTKYLLSDLLVRLAYLCEIIVLKLPTNANFNKLFNNNFPYTFKFDIMNLENKPIYTLVILSNIPNISKITPAKFPKLGYKGIKILD
jgi:hypothetical protein